MKTMNQYADAIDALTGLAEGLRRRSRYKRYSEGMRRAYPALVGASQERAGTDVGYAAWMAWHISNAGTDFSSWSCRDHAPAPGMW